LILVEQAQRDAEQIKKRAMRHARELLDAAKDEAHQLSQRVREDLAMQTELIEVSKAELEQEKRAFDLERRRIVKRVVKDLAGATVRVLLGVLSGTVQFERTRSTIVITDAELAKNVSDSQIMSYLEKPVAIVLSAWQKLSALLPKPDAARLQSDLQSTLKPISGPPDRRYEP